MNNPGEIWNFCKELPSRFLTYDFQAIGWRGFTFSEMKLLNGANLSLEEKIRITSTAIKQDVYSLCYADFLYVCNYIALQSTPGKKWVPVYECKKCGHLNPVTVESKSLVFSDITVPDLPIILDVDGDQLEFGPATVQDVLDLPGHIKAGLIPLNATGALMIKNKTFDEAYQIICQADVETGQLIDAIVDRLEMGLERGSFRCGGVDQEKVNELNKARKKKGEDPLSEEDPQPLCEELNTYLVDVEVIDILPFRSLEELDGNRVRFGNTRESGCDESELSAIQ